jgi:hypothetical protein
MATKTALTKSEEESVTDDKPGSDKIYDQMVHEEK